jgi:hypothetical protein
MEAANIAVVVEWGDRPGSTGRIKTRGLRIGAGLNCRREGHDRERQHGGDKKTNKTQL